MKLGVHFLHADEHKTFYKLALPFLMEMGRHARGTQNRKLVVFLKYLIATAFVFYCDAKHLDISRGSSHISCYLFPAKTN